MKTILLKFAGPLQSWGNQSHFETRYTDLYPSKSAVVGIIAASMGYKRDEDEKIQKLNELDYIVRIDQQGKLMRDYHIAKKYNNRGEEERTYVTNRYYLEDAVFVLALSHKDESYIKEIYIALNKPYYQSFMGRRSLPMCLDFIVGTTEQSALDSIVNCEWKASEWYKKKNNKLKTIKLEAYADSDLIDSEHKKLKKDRVISFSQKERKFGFRYESRFTISVENECCVLKKQEHDAFNALGGKK